MLEMNQSKKRIFVYNLLLTVTEMDNFLKKPDQLKKKKKRHFSIHFLVKATESTTFKHVHAGFSESKVALTSAVAVSTGEWTTVKVS